MIKREINPKKVITILVVTVALLVLVLLYAFVLKPTLNGYAVKLQNEGVNYALNVIVSEVQQNGYVEIPVGEESLILIPYSPSGSDTSLLLSG